MNKNATYKEYTPRKKRILAWTFIVLTALFSLTAFGAWENKHHPIKESQPAITETETVKITAIPTQTVTPTLQETPPEETTKPATEHKEQSQKQTTPQATPKQSQAPKSTPKTSKQPQAPSSAYYKNCAAARAAGAAPIYRGQPGYSSKLDRDGDGVACE